MEQTSDAPRRRKPRPGLAFFLSLLQPGVGQLLRGDLRKALMFFAVFPLAICSFAAAGVPDTPAGLAVSCAIGLALFIWCLIDACNGTKLRSEPKWCNKRVAILAILILGLIISSGAESYSRKYFYEAFRIPSGSSIPTLRIGDHILVSKQYYKIHRVVRGDTVVFSRNDDPTTLEDEQKTKLIKRVIGLPGEIVEVRGTQVLVDNQPLVEPYAIWDKGGRHEGNFGPERVPNSHVFFLGDNRDHSEDSRFWSDPFVPLEMIDGKALYIYWSFDSYSRIGMPVI